MPPLSLPADFDAPLASHHLLEEVALTAPFWRLLELHYARPYTCLLDSANPIKRLGRFSMLLCDPWLVYRASRGGAGSAAPLATCQRLRDWDGATVGNAAHEQPISDPFAALRWLLSAYRVQLDGATQGDLPLLAGAAGYIGYEAGRFIECLPEPHLPSLGLPDVCFGFYDALWLHCHETGKTWLSVVGHGDHAAQARSRALAAQQRHLDDIAQFHAEALPPPPSGARLPEANASHDEAAYRRAVEECKENIFAGNVFEVCLTRRLDAPFSGDPFALYAALRRSSPAPFACYLSLPEAQVISSSPERFLRLQADGQVESRPIKGTRRRGLTPGEDEHLSRQLAASEKDRAENMMIVDLVRNDLGRVCRIGSVHVPELMAIEPHATVLQMVSTIRGRLRDGCDAIDALKACFPGGSMTGAPKIEAMKIIGRLETVERGVYSGAIGYFDYRGGMDLNIVIRTMVLKEGRCYFHVGGAIVADSDPADELQETVAKARAMLEALAALEPRADATATSVAPRPG